MSSSRDQLDAWAYALAGQNADFITTVVDEFSSMRRYVVGEFKIGRNTMDFENCRRDVEAFYATDIPTLQKLYAQTIFNKYDDSTLAAVFASRKEGGTIVTKMGKRMNEHKRQLARTSMEYPATRELLTARIEELQEVINECLRS